MMPNDAILLILFIVLVLADIRFNINNSSFSKENTDLYKGICALMIFYHHLSQRIDGTIFLFCGYLAVSGFFYISGYGLMCSLKKYGADYIKDIICIKIPQLLSMCIITVGISILYFTLMSENVSVAEVLGIFKGNRLLNWYFTAIICLYLFFAMSFAIAKNNTRIGLILLTGFISIFTFILLILYTNGNIGIHWFISLYSFLIGVYLSAYPHSSIVNISRRFYLVGVLILCFGYVLAHYTDIWNSKITAIIHLALFFVNSSIFSLLLFWLVSRYQSIALFKHIGRLSGEIILTQTMALHLFRSSIIYIENVYLYIMFSTLAQVLAVILVRPIFNYFKRMIHS